MSTQFELYALDGGLAIEELPQGDALGCFASATSASTASCPASSASTLSTASTYSG
ncbi:thiocillin family RiPP [Nonomuraea typhae]|uniref:Thiocillin family RiPP n=1 Tax=Nonomuraea typhae TaxID=2603600 RepID=A0ABW7YWK3_9ACTN